MSEFYSHKEIFRVSKVGSLNWLKTREINSFVCERFDWPEKDFKFFGGHFPFAVKLFIANSEKCLKCISIYTFTTKEML